MRQTLRQMSLRYICIYNTCVYGQCDFLWDTCITLNSSVCAFYILRRLAILQMLENDMLQKSVETRQNKALFFFLSILCHANIGAFYYPQLVQRQNRHFSVI